MSFNQEDDVIFREASGAMVGLIDNDLNAALLVERDGSNKCKIATASATRYAVLGVVVSVGIAGAVDAEEGDLIGIATEDIYTLVLDGGESVVEGDLLKCVGDGKVGIIELGPTPDPEDVLQVVAQAEEDKDAVDEDDVSTDVGVLANMLLE